MFAFKHRRKAAFLFAKVIKTFDCVGGNYRQPLSSQGFTKSTINCIFSIAAPLLTI
jgi:hypothetical protein